MNSLRCRNSLPDIGLTDVSRESPSVIYFAFFSILITHSRVTAPGKITARAGAEKAKSARCRIPSSLFFRSRTLLLLGRLFHFISLHQGKLFGGEHFIDVEEDGSVRPASPCP